MQKTLKEQIKNEIKIGNLFAWNIGDGGLSEAIDCGNVTTSYQQAVEELAEELYPDDYVWAGKSFGKSKVEGYKMAMHMPNTIEQHHTWIYDLKLYLEDM